MNERKKSFKDWINVAHPWSFPASASPALVAVSYVFYLHKNGVTANINWSNATLAVFGAIIFHMAGNLIGEYQDYVSGVDQKEKTGPTRLIVQDIFKPKSVLIYGYSTLFVGVLIGIFLLMRTGLPLLFIGLFGIISSIFYYKFKYIALGDVIIFFSFGLLVGFGTAYVMAEEIIWSSLLVVAPTGLLIVAILHANNTRDMLQDKAAGIKTQAMRLGLEGSQIMYQTLLLAAYLLIALAVMLEFLHTIVFIVLLTFPMALKNIKLMKSTTIDKLATIGFLDTDTAKLVMVFSLLLVAGNCIACFI